MYVFNFIGVIFIINNRSDSFLG